LVIFITQSVGISIYKMRFMWRRGIITAFGSEGSLFELHLGLVFLTSQTKEKDIKIEMNKTLLLASNKKKWISNFKKKNPVQNE